MKIKNKPKVNYKGLNHFTIHTNEGVFLQSYDSIVVFAPLEGKIQLGKNWKYSSTTGKHRNIFLNETIKETREKLKFGIYELNNSL